MKLCLETFPSPCYVALSPLPFLTFFAWASMCHRFLHPHTRMSHARHPYPTSCAACCGCGSCLSHHSIVHHHTARALPAYTCVLGTPGPWLQTWPHPPTPGTLFVSPLFRTACTWSLWPFCLHASAPPPPPAHVSAVCVALLVVCPATTCTPLLGAGFLTALHTDPVTLLHYRPPHPLMLSLSARSLSFGMCSLRS